MISITTRQTICLSLLVLVCTTITNAYDCPENCTCFTVQRQHSSYNHAKCTSLLGLRQIGRTATIQSLDCSNIGIAKLTNQIDKLTNLTQLDLSNNQLSELTGLKRRIDTLNLSHNRIPSGKLSKIPPYVQHLNLSYNDITYIPLEFKKLIHLKTLELAGNPINCTCDTLDVRNWLTHMNVFMSHVVKCASPLSMKGKPWLQIRQSDVCQQIDESENELMLGDQPVFDDDVNGSGNDADDKSDLESDFIPLKTSKDVDHVITETANNVTDDDNEGSGDVDIDVTLPQTAVETTDATTTNYSDLTTILSSQMNRMIDASKNTSNEDQDYDDDGDYVDASGSGGGPILDVSKSIHDINATIFNEGSDEDEDDDKLIRHHDSLNIFGNINGSDEHTTLAGILESEIIEPPIKITDTEAVKTGEEVVKENKAEIALPPQPAIIDGNVVEPIQSDAETEQGQSTMILLIILGIVLVGLLAFIIVKKRRSNSRNRREKRDEEAPAGTEMLDMDKSLLGKPKNGTNGNVEFIPLMGQKPATNGNHQKPTDESLSKAQEPLLKKLEEPEDGTTQQPIESIESIDEKPSEQVPVTESNNNVVDAAPVQSGRSPIPPYRRKPDIGDQQTPAVHPSLHNGHPPGNDGDDEVFVPVSPRQGRYSPVYSPETGRVKIKLTEMPKPKTPMLVTRSRSNAGDIILTPDLNQSRNQ